jgi:hypothetical protein
MIVDKLRGFCVFNSPLSYGARETIFPMTVAKETIPPDAGTQCDNARIDSCDMLV